MARVTPDHPAAESTGGRRVQDPVAGFPRAGYVAQAAAPGEPASLAPPRVAGGKTSPQRRTQASAAGRPDPGTGEADPASGNRMPASPGRGTDTDPAGDALEGARGVPAGTTGRTFTIALPAGLKMLNLNQRLHWSEERRRARDIKEAAWAMALHDKLPRLERVSVVAEYQPPDRRHRDGDNIAKSAKHALDGIVAAGRLPGDDKRYVTGTYCTIGEPYPKGRLVLHLTEVAATGSDAA